MSWYGALSVQDHPVSTLTLLRFTRATFRQHPLQDVVGSHPRPAPRRFDTAAVPLAGFALGAAALRLALTVVAAVAVSSWVRDGLPEQVLQDALLLGGEAG